MPHWLRCPTAEVTGAMKSQQETRTRFRCSVCGKLTAGRMPKKGDTSARFPRRHYEQNGRLCPGVFRDAEWVDVETPSA